MSKYEFNEELKAYENQNMPIIPVVVPVLQFLMSFLYKVEKSDETVTVEQVEVPAEDGKKSLQFKGKMGEGGIECFGKKECKKKVNKVFI